MTQKYDILIHRSHFNRYFTSKVWIIRKVRQQQITFEEFLKIQLKVGRVIQAENIPGMKKILKVKVDLGLEEREIVVGAALYYKPEELIGQVLIVWY